MLNYTSTVLGGRDLGLPRPRPEDVIEIVRRFHRDSALVVLVRLNLALTHARPLNQIEILRQWIGPEMADQVMRAMRAKKIDVVFHEGQVLNLIRLIILYSPAAEGYRLQRFEEFQLLTRALLLVTDLMFPDGRVTDLRATIFANFTRMEVFMHDEQYVPNTMARNYDLFVMLPRLVPQRGEHIDLAATFRAVTGLHIEDYFGLGFGLLAYWDGVDPDAIGTAPIAIQRSTYLKDVRLSAEECDRLWPLVSKPIAAYRTALQEEWDARSGAARWSTMRTFTEFPMIEFPDGSVVTVSRRLLRDRVTHGIYWIIANGLEGRDRDRFTERFGDVFEEYVRRCFLRALGRGFHPHPQYGAGELPLVDGALATARSLGLPECKAGRLLLAAREIGSEVDLEGSVKRVLDRAADQLAAAVVAGQEKQIDDLETGSETRYHPIVVTYEALPSHPFALELYESIVHRDGRLRGERIKPVTLLNTRDVESLEAVIQHGEAWPDFLTRKHTDLYRHLPFHNYVYERYRDGLPENRYLEARWDRIGMMIGVRLFGEALKTPEPRRSRKRRR
jgi:hypothetical protein